MNIAIEAPAQTDALRPSEPIDETIQYTGNLGTILRIVMWNAVIIPLTLGFYRFWGQTRLRRYLWNAVRFRDDPFEYTGRAVELLIGFLLAFVAILAFYGVYVGARALLDDDWPVIVFDVAFGVLTYFLIYFAIYRVRRYQMTRTAWRGIRFGQTGSAVRYAAIACAWAFLRIITLNLVAPWANTALQRFRTENTCFGSTAFAFDAPVRPLFRRWLLAWSLFPITLGLSYFWYSAAQHRHFARHTRIGGLQFESTITGGKLAALALLHLGALAVILTAMAGVLVTAFGESELATVLEHPKAAAMVLLEALPQVVLAALIWYFGARAAKAAILIHRWLGLMFRTTRARGSIEFASIRQNPAAIPGTGEGLANALDVGGGF